MSGEKNSSLVRCVTIGFDVHTFQVLRDCGYLVISFIGKPEPCDFLYEEENGLSVDGNFVSVCTNHELTLFPTYPAFSLGEVWDTNLPIFWGCPLVHPTSFVSYDSILERGSIVGPGCILPEGVELGLGVRLTGGNILRRRQKLPNFRRLGWGDK